MNWVMKTIEFLILPAGNDVPETLFALNDEYRFIGTQTGSIKINYILTEEFIFKCVIFLIKMIEF